jgi:predicted Zn-dependent protease
MAERPMGPFGKAPGRSKIGEQVLDRRFRLRADPMDPDGGFLPFQYWDGTPYQPVNWIDKGVLRELAYPKSYALSALNFDKALPNPQSFRLGGVEGTPTATIEEMIAKTQRGILVTRLHNVQLIDLGSMLCSGYTRDGIWLIENGKITRPVKNFRFTESPLFVLNKTEEIGVPQRVFKPGYSYVAPAVRVTDFSFTSLADAV